MRLLWVEDDSVSILGMEINKPSTKIKRKHESFEATEIITKDISGEIRKKINVNVRRFTSFAGSYLEIQNYISQYDAVLLDINLSQFDCREEELESLKINLDQFKDLKEMDSDEKMNAFKREAGFHVFVKLLADGFPLDRVAFLTANKGSASDIIDKFSDWPEDEEKFKKQMDGFFHQLSEPVRKDIADSISAWNKLSFSEKRPEIIGVLEEHVSDQAEKVEQTYIAFLKRFSDARIDTSHLNCFSKTDKSQPKNLEDWIADTGDVYCELRRGIIDACESLKQLIEDKNDVLIKVEKQKDSGECVLSQEVLDKLDEICDMLVPHIHPPKGDVAGEKFLQRLARAIVHDWGEYSGKYITDGDENEYEYVKFGQVLRTARNWLAHDKVGSTSIVIKEKDVAFLFILYMRSFFKEPQTESEEQLLLLFDKPSYKPQDLKWGILENYYHFHTMSRHLPKRFKHTTNSMNIFKIIESCRRFWESNPDKEWIVQGKEKKSCEYVKERLTDNAYGVSILYQSFFHALFYPKNNVLKFEPPKKDGRCLAAFLNFNFGDLEFQKYNKTYSKMAKAFFAPAKFPQPPIK